MQDSHFYGYLLAYIIYDISKALNCGYIFVSILDIVRNCKQMQLMWPQYIAVESRSQRRQDSVTNTKNLDVAVEIVMTVFICMFDLQLKLL